MVLIGLGSNQGASVAIIAAALKRLEIYARPGTFLSSSLYRTSPVDCAPGVDDFINAAVAFEARAELTPEALLTELKAMEREFGRAVVYKRNAPRELDLDLLLFDEQTRDSERFTLPHPRAVDRLFVLAPAAEIVPDLNWPGLDTSVQNLLEQLETDEQVTRMPSTAVAERA